VSMLWKIFLTPSYSRTSFSWKVFSILTFGSSNVTFSFTKLAFKFNSLSAFFIDAPGFGRIINASIVVFLYLSFINCASFVSLYNNLSFITIILTVDCLVKPLNVFDLVSCWSNSCSHFALKWIADINKASRFATVDSSTIEVIRLLVFLAHH
jgi:hypothetical protein